MQHWREFSELIIRFRAIYDLIVISGASNLLPCCVFMLLLLSVMLKKKEKTFKIVIMNWQVMYSTVFSTEQMVQVSHRVEIENKSILLLAQEHTKDDDQQDKNYLPEQTQSSGE